MAHHRKAVATAAVLNLLIAVVEAVAGAQSGSVSLLVDSVHNLADEMALLSLCLAFIPPSGLSKNLLRSANFFNSVGLVALSGLLVLQAISRFCTSGAVSGLVPIDVGLGAAGANGVVARLLREPARANAALRLAYLHNLGDALVSLAPVLAGLLVTVLQHPGFDPAIACCIAAWIMWSSTREVLGPREQLMWPERLAYGPYAVEATPEGIPPQGLHSRQGDSSHKRWYSDGKARGGVSATGRLCFLSTADFCAGACCSDARVEVARLLQGV